jgi:hypothetical protein
VRVTSRKGGSPRTLNGGRFIAPRWDDDDNLWLTDRIGGQTRVRVARGTAVTALPIGDLANLDIDTFDLSPDTARYVVTARRGRSSAIYVGAVRRDARDRVIGLTTPRHLRTAVENPTSATWASGTRVSFLGDSESGRQVYTAIIDGSDTTGGVSGGGALLPVAHADTLVVGTAEAPPRYATDAKHRLWFLPPDGSWSQVKLRGVTGLTYGH